MALYELQRTQRIPATAAQLWEFMSSPRNLAEITPGYMNFEITSASLPEKIYAGMFICYNVRPLLGIKMNWVTEITQANEPGYFVDVQYRGPFRSWHHQHHLRIIDKGIEMTDIVHYEPPLGILGRAAHSLFLKKQLHDLFDYRRRKIEERFGIL